MANLKAVRTTRMIDLGDGVQRTARFTLNAMADMEEKYGSLQAGFDKMKEGSISATRYLLWLVLSPDDENLTEREVGNLIDTTNMGELMDTLMDILMENIPTNDAGQPATAPNRQTLANLA